MLVRIAQLAVALSIPVAALLFAGRGLLPDLFTSDVLVQREVAEVLPLLLVIMVSQGWGGAGWGRVGRGGMRRRASMVRAGYTCNDTWHW